MAMENPPFIVHFPIEPSISGGFSIAIFDSRRVNESKTWKIL